MAVIPPFPYDTNVTYIMIAEDIAHNTITSEEFGFECQYQVIPEFLSTTLLITMVITTLAVIMIKRGFLKDINAR